MKRLLLAAPFALALAACNTFPGPYGPPPYPPPGPGPGAVTYRAMGTEPFWDLTIGRDMVFTDHGTDMQVVQPTPAPIHAVAGEIYDTPRINANLVHARCIGASGRTYPDTVQVRVDGREYRGCGGPV